MEPRWGLCPFQIMPPRALEIILTPSTACHRCLLLRIAFLLDPKKLLWPFSLFKLPLSWWHVFERASYLQGLGIFTMHWLYSVTTCFLLWRVFKGRQFKWLLIFPLETCSLLLPCRLYIYGSSPRIQSTNICCGVLSLHVTCSVCIISDGTPIIQCLSSSSKGVLASMNTQQRVALFHDMLGLGTSTSRRATYWWS